MCLQLESSEFNSTQNQQLRSKIIAMKFIIFLSLMAFDFSASAMPVDLASTGQSINILLAAAVGQLKVRDESKVNLGGNGSIGAGGQLAITHAGNDILTIGENSAQLSKHGLEVKGNISAVGYTIIQGTIRLGQPSTGIEGTILGIPVNIQIQSSDRVKNMEKVKK